MEVPYETVRRWVLKFGPAITGNLRRLRPKPSPRWHLDVMAVRIGGLLMYLWRSVDDKGEVLEVLIQRRRDKAAASKLMRKLLKKQGFGLAIGWDEQNLDTRRRPGPGSGFGRNALTHQLAANAGKCRLLTSDRCGHPAGADAAALSGVCELGLGGDTMETLGLLR